jgi:uncharacterized protein (DUF39 family)
MLVFLKNTVAQINIETRQGKAPVVCAQQASGSADPESTKHTPARVDAVTSGTQGIASYFTAHIPPPKQDTDGT